MRNYFIAVILIVFIATAAIASTRAGVAVASSPSYSVSGVVYAYDSHSAKNSQYTLHSGFPHSLIKAILSPIVTSLDPREGNNLVPLKGVRIYGANFVAGATVKLQAAGLPTIIATNVQVISQNEINCDFDLTGASAGAREVIVTNTDGNVGALPSGFNLNRGAYAADMVICSPNPFDPARGSATLTYRLDQDTDVNIFIFTTTANLYWKTSFSAGTNGGKQGENAIVWNGVSNFGEMASNGLFLVHVVERNTGVTKARGRLAVLHQ